MCVLQGSDIETLGPDNAGECEDRAVSRALDTPDGEDVTLYVIQND